MKPEPAWRRYLRFWGASPERDVDDEFRFHLDARIDELRASGLGAEEARREAIRSFGPVAPRREECVAIGRSIERRKSWLDYANGWTGDVRYALRVLGNAKASTAATILILAVGIGATTAVFTVMDRMLYAPLPVPKPAELVQVSHWTPAADGTHLGVTFTYSGYAYLRDRNTVFSGLAAVSHFNLRERRAHLKIERPAEGMPVSGNYFDVLGVPALAGRLLAPSDDGLVGASHVAVASYRFSSRRYEDPRDAVGKTVFLNDLPFTIVGVMPPGFYGTQKGYDEDLYVPLGCLGVLMDGIDVNRGAYLRAFGRLQSGVGMARAQSELQVLWRQFLSTGLTRDSKDDRIGVESGARGYAGTSGERERSLALVSAIVAVLLLIGCANVACLLVARGTARQHETAIRLSLGAGPLRVLRQSMLESCLLALAGGAGALLVSQWAARLLLAGLHWEKKPIDIAPDGRVLAFALAVSLLAAVLFGLAPAVQLLRGGRLPLGLGQSVAPFATGKALVVVEVALSVILIAGAAVFVRSLRNLRAVPTGFVADRVSVIRLIPSTDDDAPVAPVREAAALADSLRGTAGIQAIGLSNLLMFNDAYSQYSLRRPEEAKLSSARVLMVDKGYFETLRIPLVAGRNFTARDDEHAPKVAVLSESLARRLFPNGGALGGQVLMGMAVREHKPGDETEIVGVVKDTKFTSVAAPAPDIVYTPIFQGTGHSHGVVLELRSALAAAPLSALVRARVRDAGLPLSVQPATALNDEIGASLADDYIRMQASSLFGGLALVLTASGLYGLIAYTVARRTREIGIRMAVGSSAAGIVGLVVRQSLGAVALGVVLGIPGAVLVMRWVSGMVFGLPPVDYVSIGIASALLAIAGLAASSAPAWRAAHLDPVKALRIQ